MMVEAGKKIDASISVLCSINLSKVTANYGYSEGLSKNSVLDKIKVARGLLLEATNEIKEAK